MLREATHGRAVQAFLANADGQLALAKGDVISIPKNTKFL